MLVRLLDKQRNRWMRHAGYDCSMWRRALGGAWKITAPMKVTRDVGNGPHVTYLHGRVTASGGYLCSACLYMLGHG